MPLYDYTCESCSDTFEHLARRMADPAPACPKCGSPKTTKALSIPAIGGSSASSSLPMGGCCPCGKNQSACSRS